jgi:hypothetical protein
MTSTMADWRVAPGEHSEGTVTSGIERIMSTAPSGLCLTLAVGCMATSAMLHAAGRRGDALFVGQCVPSILIMGLYDKLVKVAGSD